MSKQQIILPLDYDLLSPRLKKQFELELRILKAQPHHKTSLDRDVIPPGTEAFHYSLIVRAFFLAVQVLQPHLTSRITEYSVIPSIYTETRDLL